MQFLTTLKLSEIEVSVLALVRIKKEEQNEETSADLIDLPEFPTVQKTS